MPTNEELRAERMKARRRALGNAICMRRVSTRLTQQRLADVLGCSRTTITMIETGKQAISIDQLYELADVLDYDITDFLQYDLSIEEAKAGNGIFTLNHFSSQIPRAKRLVPSAGLFDVPAPAIAEAQPATSPPSSSAEPAKPSPATAGKKPRRPVPATSARSSTSSARSSPATTPAKSKKAENRKGKGKKTAGQKAAK